MGVAVIEGYQLGEGIVSVSRFTVVPWDNLETCSGLNRLFVVLDS